MHVRSGPLGIVAATILVGSAAIPVGHLASPDAQAARPLAPRQPSSTDTVATWQAGAHPGPGGVVAPSDLDNAPGDGIVVLDRLLARAQHFDADGQVVAVFGQSGGKGDLLRPLGLAVDAARRRVYIADTGHHRVAVFGLDGAFATGWTDFAEPEAVTIGVDGRVYVYDRGVNGIKVRRPDGGDEGVFPVQVAQSRLVELPRGIGTSAAGSIFFAAEAPVANAPNVLYEFSAAGLVIPPRTQLPWQVRDLAFGTGGTLLLLDGTGHRLVTQLDRATGADAATAIDPGAVAMTGRKDGTVRLLYKATGGQRTGIRSFQVQGNLVTATGRRDFPAVQRGWFDNPVRIEANPGGGALVLDTLGRLQAFAADGQALGQLGRSGLQEAVLDPTGHSLFIARLHTPSADDPNDPDGAAAGQRRYRISRLDLPNGLSSGPGAEAQAQVAWTVDWSEPLDGATFTQVEAMAFDAHTGRLVVLDSGHSRLLQWTAAGDPLPDIALPEPGGLPGYADMALTPQGVFYVLNRSGPVVYGLHHLDGGAPEDRIPLDMAAYRLSVTADGRLVALAGHRTVHIVPLAGGSTRQLTLPSQGPAGEASDVAVDGAGGIYVADYDARAVHVFAPAPVYLPIAGRP